MLKNMNFAKWVFLVAGAYGILLVAPMYFSENQMSLEYPPAITHPEYYYGFVGLTLSWQIAFLIISINPERYRLLMIPSMLEKISYVIALFVLYGQQQAGTFLLWFGGIDLLFAILFLVAFIRTPKS